jgi:hypothetical protein
VTTFEQARAAKAERDRRDRRHYTPNLLGVVCRFCHQRVPVALNAEGSFAHPTCDPEAQALLELDRRDPDRGRS